MAIVLESPKRARMTREEFDMIPEGPPFFEFVNGEAIEVNKPSGRHQLAEHLLFSAIYKHIMMHDLGIAYPEIDVELPTKDVVGPDIVYLSKDHVDRYDEAKGDVYGTPDLVVEVSSPSTEVYDRFEKMNIYERNQVPWIWLIDQDTLGIEEFSWTPGGYLRNGAAATGQVFEPKLFPGLQIDLAKLMQSGPG